MAKSKMKLNYKRQKRERKNNNQGNNNELKSSIYTVVGVLLFIGVIYLGVIGLEKLGVFEPGYTKTVKEPSEIDYEYIPIGTVFNRKENTYYVLFDNYETNKSDAYINTLVNNLKDRVYKVDMSKNENAKFISDKENAKATKVNDLKINGITLIKINKGKVVKYISGSENIEEYLNK